MQLGRLTLRGRPRAIEPEVIGELMQGEPPTTPSEFGRALAALRPRTTIRCEVCGIEKEVWLRDTQQARTCSPACRQKLYRKRRNARP